MKARDNSLFRDFQGPNLRIESNQIMILLVIEVKSAVEATSRDLTQ
jgi:hypothetical protein